MFPVITINTFGMKKGFINNEIYIKNIFLRASEGSEYISS